MALKRALHQVKRDFMEFDEISRLHSGPKEGRRLARALSGAQLARDLQGRSVFTSSVGVTLRQIETLRITRLGYAGSFLKLF